MRYGLIGGTLAQSYSKTIHEALTGEAYELCELAPVDFIPFMRAHDFEGINVTIPYKEAVLPYLDVIDPLVGRIAACNTVVCQEGKLHGYNTDYLGFRALVEHSGVAISGKKVLILGTGGTSKTTAAVMSDLGAREIKKASRTSGDVTYDNLSTVLDSDIIVNTTPVGMYPKINETPLSLAPFTHLIAVFDVVYNPVRTVLTQEARSRGIFATSGLEMLVSQAAVSAGLFRGVTYPLEEVARITKELNFKEKNIVFIGMPGAGKSGMGRLASKYLKRPFYDTDTLVEEKKKMTVKEIFEVEGEAAFRAYEREAVERVSLEHGAVISVGGGTVVDPTNTKLLKANGTIILIERPVDQLRGSSRRPLSTSKSAIKALYEKRKAIYDEAADLRLQNTTGLNDTFEAFKQLIKEGKII